MITLIKKILNHKFLLLILLLQSNNILAIVFHFPGPPNSAVPPFNLSNSDNSLVVDSGNMSSSTLGYTINSNSSSGIITVSAPATVTYVGSGDAIFYSLGGGYSATLNVLGTITSGTNAVVLNYGGSGSVFNSIALSGTINGNIVYNTSDFDFSGTTFDIDGSAQFNGSVTNNGTDPTFDIRFGFNSPVNFTTAGTISGVQNIRVVQGNVTIGVGQNITGLSTLLSIGSGTNLTTNASIAGAGATTNAGTFTIGSAGAYSMTGAFTNNSGNKTINVRGTFTVPSSFTNTGTIAVDGTSAVINGNDLTGGAASILNIGQNDSSTSFATSVATTGIQTIRVYGGSFTVNNPISGVTSFTTDNNATTLINSSISGVGATFTNNGTVFLNSGGTIGTTGTFTNAGAFNIARSYAIPAGFVNSGSIYVIGSGSISAINNITSGTSLNIGIDSTGATNVNTFTADAAISGIQLIRVYNTGSSFSSNFTIAGLTTGFTSDAGTTATFGASVTGNGGAFLNNGTMNINSSLNGTAATFTNNNIAVLGASGSINVTGVTTNTGTLTLNASFAPVANSSNSGTINVNTGATLTIPASFTSSSGTISTSGSGILTVGNPLSGIVTNAATTNVTAAFTPAATSSNTGTINVNSGGNMTIPANFTNSSGTIATTGTGILTVSNALSGRVTNAGTANIAAAFTPSATSTNSNIINVISDGVFTIPSGFTNTGAINNSGTGAVAYAGTVNIGGTLNSTGTIRTSINSDLDYGQLNVAGAVDLDNSILDITIADNLTGSWTILTSGTSLSANSLTFNPSASTSLFNTYSFSVTSTDLIIRNTSRSFTSLAVGEFNTLIAGVLDNMASNVTNSGQQALISAIRRSASQQQYNSNLQQLIPLMNSYSPQIAIQNKLFNKIEDRIAFLHGAPDLKPVTYTAGDMYGANAFWVGAFGSDARQELVDLNPGYKATSYGGMIGLDSLTDQNTLFGFGLGYSDTTIDENSNPGFNTDVIGYHVFLYGANSIRSRSIFEWFVAGAATTNKGYRNINISGQNMSTSCEYNAYEGGGRINVGYKSDYCETFSLTPIVMGQYFLLNMPNYDELYSPAALSVSPSNWQSTITIGGGVRFALLGDLWWQAGLRELRALITYDALQPNYSISANFLVGSQNFVVANSPSRAALDLGGTFDYEIMCGLHVQMSVDYEMRTGYRDFSGTLKIRHVF